MASQHPIPSLDWGSSEKEGDPQQAYNGQFVGEGPYSSRMEATNTPQNPEAPTFVDDTELVGAHDDRTPTVAIQGIVFTRPAPTVAAGSRLENASSALFAVKLGGNDPRRSAMTITSTQAFYLAPRQSMVQQGACGLVPAGSAITVTHRDEIWISFPATQPGGTSTTFPATISYFVENWAS